MRVKLIHKSTFTRVFDLQVSGRLTLEQRFHRCLAFKERYNSPVTPQNTRAPGSLTWTMLYHVISPANAYPPETFTKRAERGQGHPLIVLGTRGSAVEGQAHQQDRQTGNSVAQRNLTWVLG